MEYDVTLQRNDYIGGSDIPVIMGISTFKDRYTLLCEKAGIKENEFGGNEYTDYGNVLEPQIREYINSQMPPDKQFEQNRVIDGDLRAHTDGFNGECVLEIKTTSRTYDTVDGYTHYLVQLLLYMMMNNVERGKLAVYERPDDFDPVFCALNLTEYDIDIKDYQPLCDQINAEIRRFREDLKRLKENPLLGEEDFIPNELTVLSNNVIVFECQMAQYKAMEQRYKEAKQALFEAMQKHDVKSWRTLNGVKVTRVDGTEATTKTVKEFNADLFQEDFPEIYEKYVVEKEKTIAGRSGYVKVTLPKADI